MAGPGVAVEGTAFSNGGCLPIFGISSRGKVIMGGPPALILCMGLTALGCK
jgi:hypothetical protein